MIRRTVAFSRFSANLAWGTHLAPILECLTRQSINPCREVRSAAFSLLQRLLLVPDFLPPQSSQTMYWPEVIFDKTLLHLIDELLRPGVFTTDKRGMGETRVLAQGLVCKIFLHYLSRLLEEDATGHGHALLNVWGGILDVLVRLVGSGQRDVVVCLSRDLANAQEEAVPESLKNVLLVMSAQGVLVTPSLGGSAIWDLTWQKLDRALPKLRVDIFPGEAKSSKDHVARSTDPEQPDVGQREEK
jgi:golgi-specific brefeldin A-resistance guanine nucleotide exchange factor 1